MYIPKREQLNRKEIKLEHRGRGDSETNYSQLDIGDIAKLQDEYIIKFYESFNIGESSEEESEFHEGTKINMAQLNRFLDELESRNYNFKSRHIREFADNQLKRGYGKTFYKLFIELFLESGDYLFGFSGTEREDMERAINRKIAELLKLSMRAFVGEGRIEKKINEISERS